MLLVQPTRYGGGLLLDGERLPDELDAETAGRIEALLDSDRLELHGSRTWTHGSRAFAPTRAADERPQLLGDGLAILNDRSRPALDRAGALRQAFGFGDSLATGLVMYQEPDRVALMNGFSTRAMRRLGYEAGGFEAFQSAAGELRLALGLADFIELDALLWEACNGPLEPLRQRFLDAMPGFRSFAEPNQTYAREERDYKDLLVERLAEVLPRPDQLGEPPPTVVDALYRFLSDRDNNLVDWRGYGWMRQVDEEEAVTLAGAVENLLYGPDDGPDRLGAFNLRVWPILKRHYTKTSWAASRELPSLLLMLRQPEDYLFIKTSPMEAVARRVEPDWTFLSEAMGADEYRRCLELAKVVREQLSLWGWAPRDMIDVQSFIWVVGRPAARRRRRMVKIAPDTGAAEWPNCLAHGYIGTGWNRPGDLRQFATKEDFVQGFHDAWDEQMSRSKATEKANEVWTLMELRPGDLVVANRGKSEVLGVGTVVEPGYERREDHGGRLFDTVRVEWDTSFARTIPTQERWAFKTVDEVAPELRRRILHKLDGPVRWVFEDDEREPRLVAEPGSQGDELWWPVAVDEDLLVPGDAVAFCVSGRLRALGEVSGLPFDDEGRISVKVRVQRQFDAPLDLPPSVAQAPSAPMWRLNAGQWSDLCEVIEPTPVAPGLSHAFEAFRQDPVQRFLVRLARNRAREISRLLAADELDGTSVAAEVLDRGQVLLDGRDRSAQVFGGLQAEDVDGLTDDLLAGRLELHGHCLFDLPRPALADAEELPDDLRAALVMASDPATPLDDRLGALEDVKGLGTTHASLVTMLLWSEEQCLVGPDQLRKGYEKLGYSPGTDGRSWRDAAARLKADVAAVDHIELSRFVWAVGEGRYDHLIGAGDASPYDPPGFDLIRAHLASIRFRLDERTLRRYHLALQTRGFVILSGISGSGKTWLTKAYADAVHAEYELVAVAPNWTTNEDLLGYRNPFGDGYRDTAFSRFLRKAAAAHEAALAAGHRSRPFHLVLDEMNLARIEHYFAEFLSRMEMRARGEEATIRLGDDVVRLPPNLYFIGTVNIDETTHGFADKVYDRATLVELQPSRAELEAHLGDAAFATELLEIWDVLHEVAPFGYRILVEVGSYVDHSTELGVPWEEAFDEQVLQKILPKIRGMDHRVGPALEALLALLDGLPLSAAKARAMLDGFSERGFASYF